MLETFKARLKAKSTAAGVNLSQARIDEISARLHKKFPDLKEEADHDSRLDDLNELQPFSEMASYDDYQRGKAARDKAKAEKEKADKEKADKEKADKEKTDSSASDDTPPWAKALIESNKTLSEKLAHIESEKTQGTIKSKATELLKDVPVSYWGKRSLPEKSEDLDAFVTDVTKDYTDFKQEMVNQGLAIQTPPPAAGGGTAASTKVDPAVQAFIDKKKAAEKEASKN